MGRSLGFTEPVRYALGRLEASPDSFAQEIAEVRDHLEGAAPLTARPDAVGDVPLFVLATGSGMDTAADLGLPVVIGGPILDFPELPDRLAAYRGAFRSHRGSVPEIVVSLDPLIADTDDEALELALPEIWAMARSRSTGVFGVARARGADPRDDAGAPRNHGAWRRASPPRSPARRARCADASSRSSSEPARRRSSRPDRPTTGTR